MRKYSDKIGRSGETTWEKISNFVSRISNTLKGGKNAREKSKEHKENWKLIKELTTNLSLENQQTLLEVLDSNEFRDLMRALKKNNKEDYIALLYWDFENYLKDTFPSNQEAGEIRNIIQLIIEPDDITSLRKYLKNSISKIKKDEQNDIYIQ
jgi:hypothetical protein